MQLPSVMPILVLEVAQFICTMLAALEGRLTSLTALKLILMSTVCKAMQRMLELDVKVCRNALFYLIKSGYQALVPMYFSKLAARSNVCL